MVLVVMATVVEVTVKWFPCFATGVMAKEGGGSCGAAYGCGSGHGGNGGLRLANSTFFFSDGDSILKEMMVIIYIHTYIFRW